MEMNRKGPGVFWLTIATRHEPRGLLDTEGICNYKIVNHRCKLHQKELLASGMRFSEDKEDDAKVSTRETTPRPTHGNIWEIKDREVPTTSIPESTDDDNGHDTNGKVDLEI